ncbi:MAG: hypothetical protein M3Y56_01565, partial [Armatimonadota bacterium]|nr:hypothetical protein [Armatimonadota bacterium]
ETVGLLDLSWRRAVCITGSERIQFLHSMTTNHVLNLGPGLAQHTTCCDVTGHLVGTLRLVNRGDSIWADMHPGCADDVLAILDKHLIMEDVEITPTPDWTVLSLQGPLWRSALSKAVGRDILSPPPLHVVGYNLEEKPLDGVTDSHTGAPGIDLFVSVDKIAHLWEVLTDAVQQVGGRPVGMDALRTLRVEAGIPWWGEDLDHSLLMLEAGLEDSIHFEKGCYLGQETLARVHFRGHTNRQLMGLRLPGGELPPPGAGLSAGERPAGRITTAVFSPGMNEAIALGFVRREFLAPGTVLSVGESGAEAVVTGLPFVKTET